MTDEHEFVLKVSEDDEGVAYLKLPGHPVAAPAVVRSVQVRELVGHYEGPDVVLDFSEGNRLIGIEIIG